MTYNPGRALKLNIVTRDQVEEACLRRRGSTDDPGLCCACGAEAEGVEPDAQEYECEACREEAVFGIEEFLF